MHKPKGNTNMRAYLSGIAIGVLAACSLVQGQETPVTKKDLAEAFASPPDASRMWVYWDWLNNTVDKEGITADLEGLRAGGIGGVHLFSVNGEEVTGKSLDYMSPAYMEMFRHSASEAKRLGIEVSACLSSGWCAGGPWVTPELAIKRKVESEISVEGPNLFDGQLPLPRSDKRFYRDIAVFALPISTQRLRPTVSASSEVNFHNPYHYACDGKPKTSWISASRKADIPLSQQNPEWLQYDLGDLYPISKVAITPAPKQQGPRQVELQASDDGKVFRSVKAFTMDPTGTTILETGSLTARMLRMNIFSSHAVKNDSVGIAELTITAPDDFNREWQGFRSFDDKAVNDSAGSPNNTSGNERAICDGVRRPFDSGWSRTTSIRRDQVIDLTQRLQPDGRLNWEVPAGKWVILRQGYTLSDSHVAGVKCHAKGGGGLEIDPLDPAALDLQFEKVGTKYLQQVQTLGGKVLTTLSIDSWEIGQPNWSANFLDEFKKRRGYEAWPWLPVLSGWVLESNEASERFLDDYRKTLADCVADNYYGRLAELCHKKGLQQMSEAGGPCYPQTPSMDALKNLGRSDVPMGEFWLDNDFCRPSKQTASAAHIYGRAQVAAEAFTSLRMWEEDPAVLKPVADRAFCEGVNKCVIHGSSTSLISEGFPGRVFWAGTNFNRKITWWAQARAFTDYMARCQHLLRQGLFVADVLYYAGDGAPLFVPRKETPSELGSGYDYDICNTEVLLTRVAVKDGRAVLPDGMSYRVLVLPERQDMPLEVITKLKALVAEGLTLVGPPPSRDPGLMDYPKRDPQLQVLAAELWAGLDGKSATTRSFGKGRVVWGQPVRQVLADACITPDCVLTSPDAKAKLDWIHRRDGGTDLYFVSNQSAKPQTLTAAFRVAGRQPEMWDAVSGKHRDAVSFKQAEGVTTLPLELPANGSLFVVFRKPIAADVAGTAASNSPDMKLLRVLSGPWSVRFNPKWGGPEAVEFPELVDWTSHSDEGIRYYSGKATYRKSFELTPDEACQLLHLDLGKFNNVAEVRLNGTNLGVIWTEPHRMTISTAMRAGVNELEIDVVNLWPNRLIGDAKLAPEKRLTWTNNKKFLDGKQKPLPSGLLGPVQLLTESREADSK